MNSYFCRRLLMMFPMFLLMTMSYFFLENYLPGGPVQEALARMEEEGQGFGSSVGRPYAGEGVKPMQGLREALIKQYELDQPIIIRYLSWLNRLAHFDLGDSLITRQPVINLIKERLKVSMCIGIPTFILSYLLGVLLGIVKAIYDRSTLELISSLLLFVGLSVPLLALMLFSLFIFSTDHILPGGPWFPIGGLQSDFSDSLPFLSRSFDLFWHLALPISTFALGEVCYFSFLMKSSFLQAIQQDYKTAAMAKGLSNLQVYFRHVLINASLPLLSHAGKLLASLVVGSMLVENVFELPGLGKLMLDAVRSRDHNVAMGVVLIQSFVIMSAQLICDALCMWIDPRVDFK